MKKERRIFDPGDPNSDIVNERLPMTRRIPKLKFKQLLRDASVAEEVSRIAAMNKDAAMEAFMHSQKMLSDERYWEFLRTMWVMCGKRENYHVFRELFGSKRPRRDWFMTLEDAKRLDEMPSEFDVYRAAYSEGDDGLSWTLDREFVERYAEGKGRVVVVRRVKKSEVFAYISRRGEEEILILGTSKLPTSGESAEHQEGAG